MTIHVLSIRLYIIYNKSCQLHQKPTDNLLNFMGKNQQLHLLWYYKMAYWCFHILYLYNHVVSYMLHNLELTN